MENSGISINLQLGDDISRYAHEARTAESEGFAMVTIADHPGTSASPAVVLGALCVATSTIALCTYVTNAGAHEPLDLASDIATVDQLSGGRAVLGIGAGHTPKEWTMYGRDYPTAGQRVDRLAEMVEVTTRLLVGETVTFHGRHIHADTAALVAPVPVDTVPLLIGGGGQRLLSLAGRYANIVSYTGLGNTLPDGHKHVANWSETYTTRSFEHVREAAIAAGRQTPIFDILVQFNVVTNDRSDVLASLARRMEVEIDVLDRAPFLLVGTLQQQVEQINRNRETWGITSYTVRDRVAGAALIAALRT